MTGATGEGLVFEGLGLQGLRTLAGLIGLGLDKHQIGTAIDALSRGQDSGCEG